LNVGIDFYPGYKLVKQGLLNLFLLNIIIFFSFSFGCTHTPSPPVEKPPPPYSVEGKVYYPFPVERLKNYKEQGIASWYGPDFHGKKTSSGEIYNMYDNTAAHKLLPFGTKVEVTNLKNGKKATVVINDRGPFVKNRVIDLSFSTAKELELIGPGTALVELRVVSVPETLPPDWKWVFSVQIGAFRELENALRLKEKFSHLNSSAHINTYETPEGLIFYQVRVGEYTTLEETLRAQKDWEARGFPDAFVVAE